MARDVKGRFQKGESGNPSGRPSRAAELRLLLDGGADAVARKVLKAAKDGDLTAARLVLERCIPLHKPAQAPTPFNLDTSKPLSDQGRDVLHAIAAGDLPADTGKHLLDSLAALVRVVELDEIDRRLKAIEGAHNG